MIKSNYSAYLCSIPEGCKNVLPQMWNVKDKFPILSVATDDLTVSYAGFGESSHDAASIKSDFEIPKECGIYYFEILVKDEGIDGYLSIGLMERQCSLQRLPGWDKDSYGYHADDGKVFNASVTGQEYGPPYGAGDVIGCCLNRMRSIMFFTKNGLNLGASYSEAVGPTYAAVGMQSAECVITANFGQNEFVFDIDDYVMREQISLSKVIAQFSLPLRNDAFGHSGCVDASKYQLNPNQERKNANRQKFASKYVVSDEIKRMVKKYFIYHGYANCASSFCKDMQLPKKELDKDAKENYDIITRKQVRDLILSGKPGAAAAFVREKYPKVFTSNPKLYYSICVQNFIESLLQNEVVSFDDSSFDEFQLKPQSPVDLSSSHMEVEEYISITDDDTVTEILSSPKLAQEHNGWDQTSIAEKALDCAELVKSLLLARTIFNVSQHLFDSKQIKAEEDRLSDIFSMIAYDDFENVGKFKSIISVDRKMNLADELNSAILNEFVIFPMSPMDQFICHLSIITHFVNEKVDGYGGLIDSDQWI